MNKMPGFTAEVSLYQSSWCYSMTGDVVSMGAAKKFTASTDNSRRFLLLFQD